MGRRQKDIEAEHGAEEGDEDGDGAEEDYLEDSAEDVLVIHHKDAPGLQGLWTSRAGGEAY